MRTQQKTVVEQLAMKVHMTKGVANTFNKLSSIVAELDAEAVKGFVPQVYDDTLNLERIESTIDEDEEPKGGLFYSSALEPEEVKDKPEEKEDGSYRIEEYRFGTIDPTLDESRHGDPEHITK
jgi:hypothetical protein